MIPNAFFKLVSFSGCKANTSDIDWQSLGRTIGPNDSAGMTAYLSDIFLSSMNPSGKPSEIPSLREILSFPLPGTVRLCNSILSAG